MYTAKLVERLLRSYLDILCTLEGNTQNLHDTFVTKRKRTSAIRPFGDNSNQPWPFMEPLHAKPPMDGKTKARFLEDLHCAALDIEAAFPRLADDDKELLLKYHITQSHTLDELMKERNVTSRGSMHQRIFRSVQRLTYLMNNE